MYFLHFVVRTVYTCKQQYVRFLHRIYYSLHCNKYCFQEQIKKKLGAEFYRILKFNCIKRNV